jgi:hypothetical protein
MTWARAARTAGILAGIAALVLCAGLAFAGLPTPPRHLPTGAGVSGGTGRNVLADGSFTSGGPVAAGWSPEYSTAGRPFFLRRDDAEEVAYAGQPGDTGLHRKIEIFQPAWHDVRPGQRWRFSVRVRGQMAKAYVIVGMEWFAVAKPIYRYLAEQDVYPKLTTSWQRVTVQSPPLPAAARCLAVYVQLPELNPSSRLDIEISSASLILSDRGH